MYLSNMRLAWRSKKKDKEPPSPPATSGSFDVTCKRPAYIEPSLPEAALYLVDVADVARLETLVRLPNGVSLEEWLAWHTISLAEHVSLLYGAVSDCCTTASCPSMAGPSSTQYMWQDDKGKKVKCSAPQYTDYVMTYVHKTINDAALFPLKHGVCFLPNFLTVVRKVCRYLLHVTAHLYYAHHRRLVLLDLHTHLNTVFAHQMLLSAHFALLDPKEIAVVADLWASVRAAAVQAAAAAASAAAALAYAAGEDKENVMTDGPRAP